STELYGVDYEEMFSLVPDIRAIRILISIAAYCDYEIWLMDVKTAFLNGYLDEDIYMVQPEGFVDPSHPRKEKQHLFLESKSTEIGVMDWKSSKQSTTAMSIAEYIAVSEAGMEAVWIRKFISGFVIPKKLKMTRAYKEYLSNMLVYLVSIIERTEPLLDLERLFVKELGALGPKKLKEALGALGLKTGGTVQQRAKRLFLTKHTPLEELDKKQFVNKESTKEIALMEAKMCKILSETIIRTKENAEKKQGLIYEEMDREDDHEDELEIVSEGDNQKIYNPLKFPIGCDGKPIQHWLYKLHGLGHEFKCEICGNYTYRGRRAYEHHFKESRHHYGMRQLGIPNTKDFNEITSIVEAQQLREKIKEKQGMKRWRTEVEEEYEDQEVQKSNVDSTNMNTIVKVMANPNKYTPQDIIKSVGTLGIVGTTRELQLKESDVTALVSDFVQYLKSDKGRDKIPYCIGFLQKLIQDSHVKHQEEVESLPKKIYDLNVEHQRNVELMHKKIQDSHVAHQETNEFTQRLIKGMEVGEQEEVLQDPDTDDVNQEHQEEVEQMLKTIEDLNAKHQQNTELLQKRIQDSYARHQEYSESLQKIIEMPKHALGISDWPDLKPEHYVSKKKK
nr:splicing factor SF3a60 homolog [Tanacetum cinerariifolium]